MSHVIVDAAAVPVGNGPHPAASPYDKRISESLGLTTFEVYQIELPPGAETVRHNHLDDRSEDMYAILTGGGWVVVDGESAPVAPGQFVSVSIESERFLRAGDDGLTFIAVCSGN
ncbi:cupin [Williamsia phyllosphaerae]|uniref:Cupin domain-containing protein n=1 Tax=Williamsia phyllosphaerae TaxID=885042 RepID=A0ABQ1V3N2_9NOCA|nr:cupin [Williamsia phyllosphaerae]GGF37206.1 hypothetical protein GCM10007298_36180 [Williamsia phyllosphaerae]